MNRNESSTNLGGHVSTTFPCQCHELESKIIVNGSLPYDDGCGHGSELPL